MKKIHCGGWGPMKTDTKDSLPFAEQLNESDEEESMESSSSATSADMYSVSFEGISFFVFYWTNQEMSLNVSFVRTWPTTLTSPSATDTPCATAVLMSGGRETILVPSAGNPPWRL